VGKTDPVVYQVRGTAWKDIPDDLKFKPHEGLGYPLGMPMTAPDGTALVDFPVAGTERPLPYVYRVMSTAEWDQAQERGYFKSNQSWNLSDDEGTVGSFDSTGAFYIPRDGSDFRIVQFANKPADGWRSDPRDGYIKTQGQVSVTSVSAYSQVIPGDEEFKQENLAKRGVETRVVDAKGLDHDEMGQFAAKEPLRFDDIASWTNATFDELKGFRRDVVDKADGLSRRFVALIATSRSSGVLYRGVGLPVGLDIAREYPVGKVVDLNLTSFSTVFAEAAGYAGRNEQSSLQASAPAAQAVLMKLEAGARAMRIGATGLTQDEVLTAGRFAVTGYAAPVPRSEWKANPEGEFTVITLKQTGVIKPW
jgi:hypothetical protein